MKAILAIVFFPITILVVTLRILLFPITMFLPKSGKEQKNSNVQIIHVKHEDVTSGWSEAKRSLGRQAGKNVANRFS